jgi:hypothetical protein
VKQLPIDLELVRIAFEDAGGTWVLDGETGEVLRGEASERYLAIPDQRAAAERDRAEFIASIEDHRLRALLHGGRFDDVLREHPEERERWVAFRREHVERRILRWLESEGIEPIAPGN